MSDIDRAALIAADERGPRRTNLQGHHILTEFTAERTRAHRKHVTDSCENRLFGDPELYRTWIEEVMEAVQAHAMLRQIMFPEEVELLRKELIQVGAMTEMWVAAIDDWLHEQAARAAQARRDG